MQVRRRRQRRPVVVRVRVVPHRIRRSRIMSVVRLVRPEVLHWWAPNFLRRRRRIVRIAALVPAGSGWRWLTSVINWHRPVIALSRRKVSWRIPSILQGSMMVCAVRKRGHRIHSLSLWRPRHIPLRDWRRKLVVRLVRVVVILEPITRCWFCWFVCLIQQIAELHVACRP